MKSSIQGIKRSMEFCRPANLGAFIEENQKLWGPAFEKDMGGRKSWGVGLNK